MQGESKSSRPALATLTHGQQQRKQPLGGSKPHALLNDFAAADGRADLLYDFFELFCAEEPECAAAAADEPEHAAEPGCCKRSDQPAAWGTGRTASTSRPQCDRPRCRARRQALRQAHRRLEKAHLALIVQAWRRQVQLQRAQQATARHSAQLDSALGDRGEMEGARRELEVRMEAASQQLANQRAATATAEQALHSAQLEGTQGGRDKLEGARRAAARSLAAAGQRSSRRVATLEAQLEALSQQLAEQREAAAAAEQARQASEGEAARRREAEERSVEREAEANAGAQEARRELEGRGRELEERNLELARLQALQREAYREINRLRAAVTAAAAVGVASEEERGAMAAAVAAKEEAVTELAQLRVERDTWLQSVVASHRLGVDEGLEQASRRPRPPADERLPGGGSRRCHQRVLEEVLLERRQRRLAATAPCATRDEVEASVESEAPWEGSLELRFALALLACAFWSAL